MGAMSPTHWLIVIVVFVLLFGAKKLPDMARSVGQSARVLKGEMKGLRNDGADDETASGPTTDDPQPAASATSAATPSSTRFSPNSNRASRSTANAGSSATTLATSGNSSSRSPGTPS